MSDKEFPQGIYAKAPPSNAPSFLKLGISIKKDKFENWLATKNSEWINLDVCQSQNGKLYLSVNNWQPSNKTQPSEPLGEESAQPEFDDDIPF